ncbi:MAG: hypothetical protein NTV30_08940, partial [Chloroflexi bacterium]|nr:hypothetical protein [Chloroflexota bacterium]
FTKVDIIHSNCRGLWVEIMKDEFEKPPIEGIPDSLKNKFEGLNNAGELLKPIPKPNSPASEMLKNKAIIDNIYQESVVGMKDMFKNSGIDIGKGVKLNNDMVKGRIDDIAQKLERSFGISESNNFRRNIENKTFEDYNDFETKVKDVLDKIINQ